MTCADVVASRRNARWSAERVARLAFLVGRGVACEAIARDPMVRASAMNVHRQARRFGLAFRDAAPLPPRVVARYASAAAKRGLTREGLERQVLLAAGSDDALIDNILDDGA